MYIGEIQGQGASAAWGNAFDNVFAANAGFHHVHYEDNEVFLHDGKGTCRCGISLN